MHTLNITILEARVSLKGRAAVVGKTAGNGLLLFEKNMTSLDRTKLSTK